MPFSGKRVLVIGGTSGIGLSTARAFSDQGADVIITGTNKDAANDVANKLSLKQEPAQLELSDNEAIRSFANSMEALDIIVITAGVTHFAPNEDETPHNFESTIRVNLSGTFFAVQELSKKVVDGGTIVLTTTVLAHDYFYGATALSASRAGLEVAMKSFAVELVNRGIRVNAVSLGPIDTPAWDKAGATEEDREGVKSRVPMGRLGTPHEASAAILFLCSDEASFITGHSLVVDGGWSLI